MSAEPNYLIWNPWHGCRKYSEGCHNCYVYRIDRSFGKDASKVGKTASYYLARQKKRDNSYKLPSGSNVYICMSSDFFVEEADPYRNEIWEMIKERQDINFNIVTKRIVRFMQCIPDDWDKGYDHVTIGCTIENQHQCDVRLPLFLSLPIKHRFIICEPLLGSIDFRSQLDIRIEYVVVGGESGPEARPCDYSWVLDIREQCIESSVSFYFKQTGESFIKDGVKYKISRANHRLQAKKAKLDFEAVQVAHFYEGE